MPDITIRTADTPAGGAMPRLGSSRALGEWARKYFATWCAVVKAVRCFALNEERGRMPGSCKLHSAELSVTALDPAQVSESNRREFESQLRQFAQRHSGVLSSTGPLLLSGNGARIFNYSIEFKKQAGSPSHLFQVDGQGLLYMPPTLESSEKGCIRIDLSQPAAIVHIDMMFQSIGRSLDACAV